MYPGSKRKLKRGFHIEKRAHDALIGYCADCGHGQQVTAHDLETAAAAVRCVACGGPVQCSSYTQPIKYRPLWRCPGCGAGFAVDAKSRLCDSLTVHLRQSRTCAALLWKRQRFVKCGLLYVLPETARLAHPAVPVGSPLWVMLAANPEGVLVEVGRWNKSSLTIALERLQSINPAAPQVVAWLKRAA
jgi:hypothetical protein